VITKSGSLLFEKLFRESMITYQGKITELLWFLGIGVCEDIESYRKIMMNNHIYVN
jgi:hypothetical protein